MTIQTLLPSESAAEQTIANRLTLPKNQTEGPTLSTPEGEAIRHILLGSAGNIRQTIHLLHTLRYVENALWSPLVPIPNDQLIITPQQGEMMSILVKHL